MEQTLDKAETTDTYTVTPTSRSIFSANQTSTLATSEIKSIPQKLVILPKNGKNRRF